MPLIQKKFKFLDGQLENKKFLMSELFSLPDAYLFVMLTWAQRFIPDGLSNYPQLTRYFKELKNRPSIQKSLQEE